MVGVNRDGAIRRAFILGGALAGAAAFVFALYYVAPFGKDGAESGLIAFAAALMGGIGSAGGALAERPAPGCRGFLQRLFPQLAMDTRSSAWLVDRGLGLASRRFRRRADYRRGHRSRLGGARPRRSRVRVTRRWLIAIIIALAVLPIVTSVFHWDGQILFRGLGIFILLTFGLEYSSGCGGRAGSWLCHEFCAGRIYRGRDYRQPQLGLHLGPSDQRRLRRIVRRTQRRGCQASAWRLSGGSHLGAWT